MCLHTVPIIDPLLSRERTRPRAAIDQFGSFQTLGFFFFGPQLKSQHNTERKYAMNQNKKKKNKNVHLCERARAVLVTLLRRLLSSYGGESGGLSKGKKKEKNIPAILHCH